MLDKWQKLHILITWLEQGRLLELDGIKYGITKNGDIIRMHDESHGVELPSLKHIWSLINKISDDQIFIMGGEIELTNINQNNYRK